MQKELIKQEDWYVLLVDDCKAIITEAVFTSRWALVEGHWRLGERIKKDKNWKEYAKGNKSSVQDLAQNIGQSERTIYYSLKACDNYPKLDTIPEGKNITWNKLITKYLPAPKNRTPKLPDGKYGVIYADPPWPYPERIDTKNLYGAANYHYERKSIKDICDMKVKNLVADNAVLFMWVATNFLEDSFRVIKDWGFEYKSQMAWVKDGGQGGIGYYFWGDHELLLVATKGSYLPKQKASSVLKAPRQEHSQKPKEVYDIIEKMYPKDKYIELFLRGKPHNKNWIGWGNEAI